jgi:hypothetical protein
MTAARFGISERATRARETAGQFSDLTIHIGDGEQNTIFSFDNGAIDDPPIRSQIENPLNIDNDASTRSESETETTATEGDAGSEVVDEVDVAEGNQVLKQRTGTGTDTDVASTGAVEIPRRLYTPIEMPMRAKTGVGSTVGSSIGGGSTVEGVTGASVSKRTPLAERDDVLAPSVPVAQTVPTATAAETGGRVYSGPMSDVFAPVGTETDQAGQLEVDAETRAVLRAAAVGDGQPETRVEPNSEDRNQPSTEGQFEFNIGGESWASDDFLAPGWVSETFTAYGTEGIGLETLSQSALEEQAAALGPGQELPTYEMVRGSDTEQAGVAQARQLFSGLDLGSGSTSSESSSSSEGVDIWREVEL